MLRNLVAALAAIILATAVALVVIWVLNRHLVRDPRTKRQLHRLVAKLRRSFSAAAAVWQQPVYPVQEEVAA